MEFPVQITYREMEPSEPISGLIREEAGKLERFFDRIVSCRVVIEREQHHLRTGAPFRVHIDIGVPGEEITIDSASTIPTAITDEEATKRRKSSEVDAMYKDPALAVRDAFRRATRQLQDHARRMKGPHVRSSIR